MRFPDATNADPNSPSATCGRYHSGQGTNACLKPATRHDYARTFQRKLKAATTAPIAASAMR